MSVKLKLEFKNKLSDKCQATSVCTLLNFFYDKFAKYLFQEGIQSNEQIIWILNPTQFSSM